MSERGRKQPLPVIFITGATASGKSAFAHALIDKHFTEGSILSADSMQIYTYMNIGTAKPTPYEQERYRYHLVDCVSPLTSFTLKDYLARAGETLPHMPVPIFIVGGTGLYVRGLKEGVFDEPDDGGRVRALLTERCAREGVAALYRELHAVDPDAAETIAPAHERRVIRALEVWEKMGVRFSEMKARRTPPLPLTFITYTIKEARDTLYDRINRRVDRMFDEGLVDEVRALIEMGVTPANTAMQGIGYKEVYAYLAGDVPYDEVRARIKCNTRRYAKRQETWFKKENARTIERENIATVAGEISHFLEEHV